MSENNWETQPRLRNGKFTFRFQSIFIQNFRNRIHEILKDKATREITHGGSYGFLKKIIKGNKFYEIHHMPAASVSYLSKWKGPCIIINREDHKKTGSYGHSKRSKRYRKYQAKLISEGHFIEAEKMDIKNITRKFGDRYNKSISEKITYEKELLKEGTING